MTIGPRYTKGHMCIPNKTNVTSIFPHRESLEEVRQEAIAALPIDNPNELMAILELQRNTINHIERRGQKDA